MATSVEVSNMALDNIGAPNIQQLEDETREARACRRNLGRARRFVLSSGPWNSAIKTRHLAKGTVPDGSPWMAAFALPADYLRFWDCSARQYELSDGLLLCNADPLVLQYVSDPNGYHTLHPACVDAIAAQLAAYIVMAVRPDMQARVHLEERAERTIALGLARDAVDSVALEQTLGPWLEARLSGAGAPLGAIPWGKL